MNVTLRTLFVGLLSFLPTLALAQSGSPDYVPLTALPGLEASGSPDLATLLNNLYKISIGVAAVIAIVQIVRAGILFMTNQGSISENEQAKHLVQTSIIGLILILSPAVVFGIVNPRILNLDLDFSSIKSTGPGRVNVGDEGALPGTGPSTEGTGDETVDPNDERYGGMFFSALVTDNEREADQFVSNCTMSALSAEARRVIAEKRGRKAQQPNQAGTGYVNTALCESTSIQMYRYQLCQDGLLGLAGICENPVPRDGRIAPISADAHSLFTSGCATNSGRYVEDADAFTSGAGWCDGDVTRSVNEAGLNPENLRINCQQFEARCIKR